MSERYQWNITVDNRDTGSLKTGNVMVKVGDHIQIRGEDKTRKVTNVSGKPGNFHAYCKGTGAFPLGTVEWAKVLWEENGDENNLNLIKIRSIKPSLKFESNNNPSRLENLKLILEIIAVILTIIGGAIALLLR